jgi:hypothetical protein
MRSKKDKQIKKNEKRKRTKETIGGGTMIVKERRKGVLGTTLGQLPLRADRESAPARAQTHR